MWVEEQKHSSEQGPYYVYSWLPKPTKIVDYQAFKDHKSLINVERDIGLLSFLHILNVFVPPVTRYREFVVKARDLV